MNPFASIWDDRPTIVKERPVPVATPKPKPAVDHTAAKAVYDAYQVRKAELTPHRDYAKRIVTATAGGGMTPVKPFAVMGCGGGPLLCDHCHKPIPLEGGQYNNVPADQAWFANLQATDKWVSYIKGGVVVEIASNGTLRIYHGYQHNETACCQVAKRATDAADARFQPDKPDLTALMRFLRAEFPDRTDTDHCAVIGDVMLTLYSYDPGIGVNRPE